GVNAIHVAVGMGARVTVVDKSIERLRELDMQYGPRLNTCYSTQSAIDEHLTRADLVIGAVLVPGAAAPKLIRRNMLSQMRPGSVIVDVAIDQGGCAETSKVTTHDNPTYVIDQVIHYGVANMPGAAARTSAFALNNATLSYTLKLADLGYRAALLSDPGFLKGLNVHEGKIACKAVAEALKLEYHDPQGLLS
ncbi:MAG: alanine dehydrogenase, partial [Gammaproteobacteria bacterium]|nr:alanine dehydrogenase [Gammaproteobacteria bacterium]